MFGYYNPQNYAAAVSNRIDELNKKVVYSLLRVENLEQLLLNSGIAIPNGDGSEINYGQQIANLRQDINTLSGLDDNLRNLVANSSSVNNSIQMSQLEQDYNTLKKQVNRLSDAVDDLPNSLTEKQYNDVVSWAQQVPSIQSALSNVITQLNRQNLLDVHEILTATQNAENDLGELDSKLRELLNPTNNG
jgi:DNA repair exonuclease SbcCD ATPase subunit